MILAWKKNSHRRSESRRDASAASCSQTEKRPLNNNILLNAPLPCTVATGSNRWRDYWELDRGVTEQGPSWPRQSHLSLSASAGVGSVIRRLLRNAVSDEAQLISFHCKGSSGWRTGNPSQQSLHELEHQRLVIIAPFLWINLVFTGLIREAFT